MLYRKLIQYIPDRKLLSASMTLMRVCISTCCCPPVDERSISIVGNGRSHVYVWLPVLFLGPKLTPRSIKHKEFRFYQRTFSRLIDVCAICTCVRVCLCACVRESNSYIHIKSLWTGRSDAHVDVLIGVSPCV